MSTTTTINWEQLAMVVGDEGDPGDEEMQDLFRLFLDDAGGRLRKMCAPDSALDRTAIAKEAHKVRGAAASFGFEQLVGILTTIEVKMEEHSPEQLESLVQDALRTFDRSASDVGERYPNLLHRAG